MNNKKFIAAALIAASSTVAFSQEKVKIIHKGKVIEVSSKAVQAHLSHGDRLYQPAPPTTNAPAPPPPTPPPTGTPPGGPPPA